MTRLAYPASFAQQRLWFLDQLDPETAAYNLPRAFRIAGPLDVDILKQAFQMVVRRHSSLRTIFDSVDGEARQIILSDVEVEIPVIDLAGIPAPEREAEALRIASEEGKKPFDLSEGPLLRPTLVRLDPEKHFLVLVIHHIVTDGWSIALLFREVTMIYAALTKNETPALPELTLQYAEYAQWQREYMSGDLLKEEIEHWKRKLGAQTLLDLPTDHPRPSSYSWHGATEEISLDSSILAKLKALAQAESSTLFMLTMAAFQALLWRYTNQESILIGTPIAGRSEIEIENMIGLFVNTLVFRADFARNLRFRELVRQTRSFALEAYNHQDVPFEKLVEELIPQRSLETHPLFQVMFTFQNIPKQVFEIPGLKIKEMGFEAGIAKFDLSVEVWENDEFHCQIEYNTDLFEQSTICRMLGHFEKLLSTVVENPDLAVAQIPIMSTKERQQVLVDWNQTAADYPRNLPLHRAFEGQVNAHPGATAFLFDGKKWSYREVNDQANRLARRLVKSGVGSGSLVGIFLERSAEMVIALLGVLKAGAAYVPLDPAYPRERLKFLIEDAALSSIVTHSSIKEDLPDNAHNIVALDTKDDGFSDDAPGDPQVPVSSDQRAYVIYTSGSTGVPKGVEGTHRASMNRFSWMWKAYPFKSGEVCCQKTNLGFVDSIWEIFGPLLAGIPNVIIPQEAVRDPEEILKVLARERVTRIVLVPSLLRTLLDHDRDLQTRVPDLRLWSCSGEILPADLAKRFREAFPEATLLNIYGSSEVAADVTCHHVSERDLASSVAIGRPISNTQVYLADEYGEPAPIGIRGQIFVGGDNLARGYLNRPELTAERFVTNWLAPELSPRLYRTGDLGRFRSNGEIEYLGRVDNQVKLRGLRIELGEIESVLTAHDDVAEAVVIVSGEGEQQKLAAYLVMKDEAAASAGELRRYLRSKLPEHMVPANYWQVEALPLLPSGKVNRSALTGYGKPLVDREELTAPRNEIETKLAEIWQELLQVEHVGIEQNFFELGGHSLLVLQVTARIRRIFEVELAVRSVFEAPTIAGLALEVQKAQAMGLKARSPIVQRRPRHQAASREALLAQLDTLSSSELQSLLQRVLDGKQPA